MRLFLCYMDSRKRGNLNFRENDYIDGASDMFMTPWLHAPARRTALAAATIGCIAFSPISSHDAAAMTLKQALENAYELNPVLQSERENLGAIDERVAQAVSEFRPTLTADYSRGRQRLQLGGTAEGYSTNETRQITLTQPIFDGFGSVARYRASELQVQAGRAQLKAVTQDVLLQTITAYMDVLRDKAVLELSKNNVGVLNKQLEAAEDRFEVGEVTRTDVAQSKARVSGAVSEQAQAAGELASSIATFRRVVRASPGVLRTQELIPDLPATLESSLSVAERYNPSLRRAMHSEGAFNKEVSANKAEVLPSVSLQGYLRREEGAGILGGSDFDNDAILLNVSVPLYQSGAEYSRVREAKQNHRRARYETQDARNETVERVTRAWENLQASVASIQANDAAIEAADIALEGVKQEQQYGARTVLDVLDAEQELFTARVNLVRAQRNKLVAAYTLLAEMGQLTPQTLGLDVKVYNPEDHYQEVKYQPIGW